mmetsp:Transcript_12180/g.51269  ORF Transcript_12180/g.51269 Transcript_12180/m.51269 type:complete len:203 (-) Transcript_12180:758-1366(-)
MLLVSISSSHSRTRSPALTFADSVQYSTISRCLPGPAGRSQRHGQLPGFRRFGATSNATLVVLTRTSSRSSSASELDPLPQTGAPALPAHPVAAKAAMMGGSVCARSIELAATAGACASASGTLASAASRASRSRASARWRVRSSRLRRSTVGGADSFAAALPLAFFGVCAAFGSKLAGSRRPGTGTSSSAGSVSLMDTPLV